MRVAAVIVFATALAIFLPALANGFAYDDVAVIQGDPRVHSLTHALSWFTRGYWADAELALYRPLTTASFAVDWVVSGGRAGWFMFMNALWHAVVSMLVFVLLRRYVPVPAALAGALVFAVHPVHVEAVANVVGRAEVMAAALMLSALLLWPRPDDAHSPRRYGLVALLYALALLTKESAIMLPALLALVDVANGALTPGSIAAWLRRRAVVLTLLALVAVVYLGIRAAVLGGVAPSRLDAVLEVTSGPERLFTALQAWPVYIRLLLFPRVLLADYGPRILMPADTLNGTAAAGALLLIALIAGGLLLWRRHDGRGAMALLWFPLAILPVSNLLIPIGIIVAERTLYLPSVALCIAVALFAARMLAEPRVRLPIAAGAFALILALLTGRTLTRIPDWSSTDSIFAALLRDRPDSFRAHWHHARLAAVAGEPQRALGMYVHALELWPHRRRLVLEAVPAAARAGHTEYARSLAEYASARWPGDPEIARLHAAATLDAGDTTAARRIITAALAVTPGDSLLLRMQSAISDGTNP